MSLLVPLALGLLLGSPSPPHRSTLAVVQAQNAPAPDHPRSTLVPTRLSRRPSTTRVERSASLPGARVDLSPCQGWSQLQRVPNQASAPRHRAAAGVRGPPPVL